MACLDPEVVAYLEYRADKSGWAHSMQVRVCAGGGGRRATCAAVRPGRVRELPMASLPDRGG